MTSAPAEGGPGGWDVLDELAAVLEQRKQASPEGSYSATLLGDPERATRKIVEEAYELCVELLRAERDDERIASEAADLVFHTLVGLAGAGVDPDSVAAELRRRRTRDTAPRTETPA